MKLILEIHSNALQEQVNSFYKRNVCLKYLIYESNDKQEFIKQIFNSNNKSELLLKLDLLNLRLDFNHVDKKRLISQGIIVTIPLNSK